MNNRWKNIGVTSTVLLVSAAVMLFLFRSGNSDRALDLQEGQDRQAQSSGNAVTIDTLTETDQAVSGSAASLELIPSPRQFQDGDVMGQSGDFLVFKQVAKNCAYVTREGRRGTDVLVKVEWRCDADTVADHPYGLLDNAQLEQIASTDGVAALILGLRLRSQATDIEKYQEAIRYLYSSVLLTGEPQAYETLMVHQDILLGIRSHNDQPDAAANAKSYVWAKAGQQLGLIDEQKVSRIRNGIITDEDIDLENLDTMAADLAQQFNEQRQSLIGEIFK